VTWPQGEISPLTLGRVASFYYLHYTTVRLFHEELNDRNDVPSLLQILCNTAEYEVREFPPPPFVYCTHN
jgi:activating signal cointegrator complex subunit 3